MFFAIQKSNLVDSQDSNLDPTLLINHDEYNDIIYLTHTEIYFPL